MNPTSISEAIAECNSYKIKYQTNIRLSSMSSFKIGGESPLIIEPGHDEEVFQVLKIIQRLDLPYKVLGGGTNILISDHPDDFIILRLGGEYKQYKMIEPGLFEIGGATNTTPIFRQISQQGYTGAEFLSTIPGWTGGAVIQNAGCYGGELLDLTTRIDFIQEGKLESKAPSEIDYGYRYTEFLRDKNSVILRVRIVLDKGNIQEIEQSLKDKREKRNSSQPENKKSAGSIFKNPNITDENGQPIKAWELIDKSGLRGKIRGGAQISPEHCNFIVNLGDAKAVDVYDLIQLVLEKVERDSGVLLQREVEDFGTIP